MASLVQFAPTSPFYAKVNGSVPLDGWSAHRAAHISELVGSYFDINDNTATSQARKDQLLTETGAFAVGINTTTFNVRFIRVQPTDPKWNIGWYDYSSGHWKPTWWDADMAQVPIPLSMVPPAGTDASISLYDAATDTLWELWKVRWVLDGNGNKIGVEAAHGGKMANCASHTGVFSGSKLDGVSASGMALAGGAITLDDVQKGVIDHALYAGYPDIRRDKWRLNAGSTTQSSMVEPGYCAPAVRNDGRHASPINPKMGARFRLPANLNPDDYCDHPIARMIFVALQQYGGIISDTTAKFFGFHTESILPDADNATYWQGQLANATGPTGSQYYTMLKKIPWGQMEWIEPGWTPNPSTPATDIAEGTSQAFAPLSTYERAAWAARSDSMIKQYDMLSTLGPNMTPEQALAELDDMLVTSPANVILLNPTSYGYNQLMTPMLADDMRRRCHAAGRRLGLFMWVDEADNSHMNIIRPDEVIAVISETCPDDYISRIDAAGAKVTIGIQAYSLTASTARAMTLTTNMNTDVAIIGISRPGDCSSDLGTAKGVRYPDLATLDAAIAKLKTRFNNVSVIDFVNTTAAANNDAALMYERFRIMEAIAAKYRLNGLGQILYGAVSEPVSGVNMRKRTVKQDPFRPSVDITQVTNGMTIDPDDNMYGDTTLVFGSGATKTVYDALKANMYRF